MKRMRSLSAPAVLCLILCISVASHAEWIHNGNSVCGAAGHQYLPRAVPDGVGGAIVVWGDLRTSNYGVYAQRITGTGQSLWTADGVRLCSVSSQEYPEIVSDGEGGAIAVWIDYRAGWMNADIYAQRIGSDGALLWAEGGVPICRAIYDQLFPVLVSDGAGGAIVVWEDWREIGGTAAIYAQRIDAGGAVQWEENGVPVCEANLNQVDPRAVPDGAGGALVAWLDYRDASAKLYVQRIDANGKTLWAQSGVTFFSALDDRQPIALAPDGSGGAIIAWVDVRSGESDIFAQRVDAGGALRWDTNGSAVCSMGYAQILPAMASDGAGGVIVAWTDFRSGGADIYAQRMSGAGFPLWAGNGIALTSSVLWQNSCILTADGAGGVVAVWQDMGGGGYPDLCAQRLSPEGESLWSHEAPFFGVTICGAPMEQQYQCAVSDGVGGAIVAWMDYRNYYDWDIYAQRVDAAGNTVVATLLQRQAASYADGAVTLEWRLSELDEGTEFFVLRSGPDEDEFTEIAAPAIEREGLSFRFRDGAVEPGGSYRYRVDVLAGGERRALFTTDAVSVPAMALTLFQNRPNPFNPSTEIAFYLPERGHVRLAVYDVSGALVRCLVDGVEEIGAHTAAWDGRDGVGRLAASGVYFCRLESRKTVLTRKLILLR